MTTNSMVRIFKLKLSFPFVIAFFGVFCTIRCTNPNPKLGNFQVLPSPQQFDIQGTSDLGPDDLKSVFIDTGYDLPLVGELLNRLDFFAADEGVDILASIAPDINLGPEGYHLKIDSDKITIMAEEEAGLLYGFMTLQQLVEDATDQGVNLPLCEITDQPELTYRAIHLDVKHHREKKDYYFSMMDRLSQIKVNAIILEIEDKLQYPSQPVGSPDAFTTDQWREINDYALARNIEISPLVQGLGHASFILKHEQYNDVRDDPESDWAFNPLDDRTYEIQFDLYRDAMEAFPNGRYLHVGGDEVHTTGRESGKSPLELNLIWLNKVCQYAAENGRTPIFWDDMPLKYANFYSPLYNLNLKQEEVDSIWNANESLLTQNLDEFPKNCVYMRWNYHTPQALANKKAMTWFTENGMHVMGATSGQTRWVLMPQRESNIQNIRSFAISSIESGSEGLLLTLWDDDSPHFELYWRGIYAFSEYTWSGDKRSKDRIKTIYRHRAFGPSAADESLAFIDKLEEPVGKWLNALVADKSERRRLVKLDDPLEAIIDLPDLENKGKWTEKHQERLASARKMLAKNDSVAEMINRLKEVSSRNQFTLEVYEQVNELTRFTFETLLALEKIDTPSEVLDDTQALEELDQIKLRFSELRENLEMVYGKSRVIEKPDNYLLDQDHHRHNANQTRNFDWQFIAELKLLEKLDSIELK